MPCRMSPKSSIHVQSKPMENHSTGMLMNVMEIPRAKITLEREKHYLCLFPVCREKTQSRSSQRCAQWVTRKRGTVQAGAADCHQGQEVAPPASKPPGTKLLQAATGKRNIFSGRLAGKQRDAIEVSGCPWVEGMDRRGRRDESCPQNTCPAWEQPTSARVTSPRHPRPDSLLQQDGSARHQRDPPPVPDHDDQNAGGEEGFHGKPHFCKASVLMDTLGRNKAERDSCTGF